MKRQLRLILVFSCTTLQNTTARHVGLEDFYTHTKFNRLIPCNYGENINFTKNKHSSDSTTAMKLVTNDGGL